MKKPINYRTQAIIALALVGAAALLASQREAAYALLSGGPAAESVSRGGRGGGVPVITTAVVEVSDNVEVEAVGTGAARQFVILRADAAGVVVSLGFDAPKSVAAGDVLLRLDDRDETLALELAETRLKDAERRLERQLKLQQTGVASASVLDDARTAAEIARIQRDQAAHELNQRVVAAPFDGVVGFPKVDVGDRIDSDDEITTFDDRSALYVEFQAPESLMSRLVVGGPVAATTPAFPGREFDGVVDKIDSRVDSVSRALTLRAVIPNREDLLRPGMSFAVRLMLAGERRPAAPELALQWERDGAFVWRVVDGEAVKTPVRLVARSGGLALLEGELSVGEQVVVEGVQRLRPGRAVDVLGGGD